MTLKLQTFKPIHFKDLTLQSEQAAVIGVLDTDYGLIIEAQSRVAISMTEGARVLACFGLLSLWSGVAEAFMLASPDVGRGSLMMCHSMRQILDVAHEHRIQASVWDAFPRGVRFLEFLGFKREGWMEQYDGLKRNHYRYVRIKHG